LGCFGIDGVVSPDVGDRKMCKVVELVASLYSVGHPDSIDSLYNKRDRVCTGDEGAEMVDEV